MHFNSFWMNLKWSNYLPQLTTWLGSGTASWIKGSRMTTKLSILLPHTYLRGIFFTQINHDIYNFLITLRINVEGCRVQKKPITTFSLTKFSGIDFVQEFFKHQGLVKLRYLQFGWDWLDFRGFSADRRLFASFCISLSEYRLEIVGHRRS